MAGRGGRTTPDTPATTTGGTGGFAQRLSTETKQAFKTTEFWAFVAVLIGLFIAGNSIEREEGGSDVLDAGRVWLYAILLTIGYMVSRGLAKSGVRDPYNTDDRGDRA